MGQWLSNTASGLCSVALKVWTAFLNACRTALAVDARPYRPELYYMRGPGPKWREKHPHWRDSAVR
jgi:hypothetical protein